MQSSLLICRLSGGSAARVLVREQEEPCCSWAVVRKSELTCRQRPSHFLHPGRPKPASQVLGPVVSPWRKGCGYTPGLQGHLHQQRRACTSWVPRPDKRRVRTLYEIVIDKHLDKVCSMPSVIGVRFPSGQVYHLSVVSINNVAVAILGPQTDREDWHGCRALRSRERPAWPSAPSKPGGWL